MLLMNNQKIVVVALQVGERPRQVANIRADTEVFDMPAVDSDSGRL